MAGCPQSEGKRQLAGVPHGRDFEEQKCLALKHTCLALWCLFISLCLYFLTHFLFATALFWWNDGEVSDWRTELGSRPSYHLALRIVGDEPQ